MAHRVVIRIDTFAGLFDKGLNCRVTLPGEFSVR
jgi:hypothetical protein